MDYAHLQQQLEELNLLQCSLMPGESLQFLSESDNASWQELLAAYSASELPTQATNNIHPARFQIHLDGVGLFFEVQLPLRYLCSAAANGTDPALPQVLVRGDGISRGEQEKWQAIVKEKMVEVRESEYPLYELISTHLLPLLHEDATYQDNPVDDMDDVTPLQGSTSHSTATRFHALLTSHHLISPTKRRNLQHWSSQLQITGFAKVGYPGVIYCEGPEEQVEQFVANIKAMQWLALRVRFVEPAPSTDEEHEATSRWIEFEKVGEVVEEMRRLHRENYVVEMGIGSAGTK